MGRPAFDPVRPIPQQRVAIVPLVFSGCAMEPDIGEICGQLNGRLRSAPIVNAESNLMLAEQGENGGGVPAFIAKLEHVPVSSGQCRKKIRQPPGIYMPPGRKLKEDRSQLGPQQFHSGKEQRNSFVRVAVTLDMSDEATCLHAQAELARCGIVPVPEGNLGWEPIKSVVHLDCVKYACVQLEPLRRRTLLRIKGASPMLVVPARGADSYLRGHSSLAAGRAARSGTRGSSAPATTTPTSGRPSLPRQSAMGGAAAAFSL